MTTNLTLRPYQQTMVDMVHYGADDCSGRFLVADMGLGKTAATLSSLITEPSLLPALIIAPPRVARYTWPAEAALWAPGLETIEVVSATARQRDRLVAQSTSPIVCVSRDAIPEGALHRRWGSIVVDESSGFADPKSKRLRAVKQVQTATRPNRTILLTGTPAAQGLIKLLGQGLLLDGGKRLGYTKTDFQRRWQIPVRTIHVAGGKRVQLWEDRPEAPKEVAEALKDISVRVDYGADGAPALPDEITATIPVDLPPKAVTAYRSMKEKGMAIMEEELRSRGRVTASSAADISNRLAQITAGFLYDSPNFSALASGPREVETLHKGNLEAVVSVTENVSTPVLVLTRFRYQTEQIRKAVPGAVGPDHPNLEGAWNAGDIPALVAHPASIGHGLNLQKGPGHTAVWASLPWSYELWAQTNRRLIRPGQASAVTTAVVTAFTRGTQTIDHITYNTLQKRGDLQQALLTSLRH